MKTNTTKRKENKTTAASKPGSQPRSSGGKFGRKQKNLEAAKQPEVKPSKLTPEQKLNEAHASSLAALNGIKEMQGFKQDAILNDMKLKDTLSALNESHAKLGEEHHELSNKHSVLDTRQNGLMDKLMRFETTQFQISENLRQIGNTLHQINTELSNLKPEVQYQKTEINDLKPKIYKLEGEMSYFKNNDWKMPFSMSMLCTGVAIFVLGVGTASGLGVIVGGIFAFAGFGSLIGLDQERLYKYHLTK